MVEVEVDVVNHIIFSTHVARGYVGFGAEVPGRRSPGFTSPYGVRPVTGPAQVSWRASNVTAWAWGWGVPSIEGGRYLAGWGWYLAGWRCYLACIEAS